MLKNSLKNSIQCVVKNVPYITSLVHVEMVFDVSSLFERLNTKVSSQRGGKLATFAGHLPGHPDERKNYSDD